MRVSEESAFLACSFRYLRCFSIVVTLALVVAIAPFFVGLFFVLPILGHTTWHLYRRLVEPEKA